MTKSLMYLAAVALAIALLIPTALQMVQWIQGTTTVSSGRPEAEMSRRIPGW